MRLHTATLAIFMVACGTSGGSWQGGQDTFVYDTAIVATGDGTQIGSEGFWGCEESGRTLIANENETLEGFSSSPAELVAPLIGAYTGELVDSNTEVVSGTLTFGNIGRFELVEVVQSGSCTNYIHVEVDGALQAGGLASGNFPGAIGIRADESRLAIASRYSQITGTAVPLTFDPALMDTIDLTVAGIITATELMGTLVFVGCLADDCTTDATQGTFSFTADAR